MWKLKVTEDNFYSSYLQILNGILKLTRTEISVLSLFMDIKDKLDSSTLSEDMKNGLLLSTENRKYVQDRLNITEHNLNNYVKILKDKKMIVDGTINKRIFIKKNNGQTITFRLDY